MLKSSLNFFPPEIKAFGGNDGVYSKTYSYGGRYDTTLDDPTLKLLGDRPVEKHILHLLRDHFPGKAELEKKYDIDFAEDGFIADIIRDAKINDSEYDEAGGVALAFNNGLVGFAESEDGEYGSEAVIECAARLKHTMDDYAMVCDRHGDDMLHEIAIIMATGIHPIDKRCIKSFPAEDDLQSNSYIETILNRAFDEDALTPSLVKRYVANNVLAPSDCYCGIWSKQSSQDY